ncbi:response regulator [Legionella jamestowniensis]|uniref:Chemotaxis protein CheA n=1 Tax=Legionella jamestowniensis TaxID=455 RepID=A0A0W0UNH0_9GAMM|nr:response regulator [Legionella jamestowniensis]KTD09422.1 chemotaxis histidine kinase [Legionella jamestowniensis]OCH99248.1 hypothetical protein A8135_08365 [Legionella jamestowniensis]SFL89010.1 two-component system, chemotaxis family, sensor kinase CheA [Legionella jamestowniensis DSM 19215]
MAIDAKLAKMLLETFKAELQELHQSMINSLLSLEKISSTEELEEILKTLFRYSHNMKGAAASASVEPIALMAHRLEDLFSNWRQKKYIPNKKQINACLEVIDNLLVVLKAHCQGEVIDVENYLAPLSGGKSILKNQEEMEDSEFIKLPLKRVERASAKANEFITYRLKLENWFKVIEYQLKELSQLPQENLALIKNLTAISAASGQFLGEFSRSVQALQDELKVMRMLPVSTILIPLARTVRDVASNLNKTVELQVQGGDIELDKAILDAIKDPLQHLVRNAIAHGIESNEIRKKLKKPIPAKLIIEVTQSAGKIKLSVNDDGQGIQIEKLRKRALAMEFYKQDELNALNDEQILEVIFASGFTTQEDITEIAGRGVGLDAVKSDIEKIKGTISIATKEGKGSSFTLTLPLTLATTRGVFFKLKEQVFMLPTLSLTALYEIKLSDLKVVDNQYILIVKNKPIPIKILNQLLKIDESPLTKHLTYYGLLINYQAKPLIFLVDAIISEHDCVVKPLPFPFSKLKQFIGVTLTGESELVLVLDPVLLMKRALTHKTFSFQQITTDEKTIEHQPLHKKRILIVDDSLTTRSLCTSALEAAGYETVTAINGKEAWHLIQTMPFDCIVTDILMPEMNGYELTDMIKKDARFSHIPVIIVSLLDSQEDKDRGFEAGANVFLVKSEFDTHSLLEILESLL